MKPSARMSAKFIAATLAAGCVVGALIPLPHRQETTEQPSAERPTRNSTAALRTMSIDGITTTDASAAAATHPQEFFHAMLKADPQPPREIVEAFFAAWIERNPDAAFLAALQLPGRFGYEVQTSQFFPRQVQLLFQRDPAAALRWVGRIEGVIGHDITLHSRADQPEKVRALDPDEVRTWLNRCPVGGVSTGMARNFAEALAARDPAAAVRWVGTLNVEYQNTVLPMILLRLAEKDPQAAMDFLRSAPSHIRQHAMLFANRAESAPEIIASMKRLEEEMGVTSNTGINNLLMLLYRAEPSAAIGHVTAMEGTTQGVDAARGLAEAACYGGPTAGAVAMIAKLPPSLRTEAARAAMFCRMPGDFPAFLAPLADGSITGPGLDAYIDVLAGFVDGERGTSFGRQQITWTVADLPQHLEAFQKWMAEHPGPQRDEFIRRTAATLKDKPELRDKVFSNIPPEEMERISGAGHSRPPGPPADSGAP